MKQFRIPIDTRRYILETLQFAPVAKRDLDRHMRRRSDYGPAILDLMSRGLIEIAGSGKKGSPIVFKLTHS